MPPHIMLMYGEQVLEALDAVKSLPMDTIAPNHGVTWRSDLAMILKRCRKWAGDETGSKAITVYDDM